MSTRQCTGMLVAKADKHKNCVRKHTLLCFFCMLIYLLVASAIVSIRVLVDLIIVVSIVIGCSYNHRASWQSETQRCSIEVMRRQFKCRQRSLPGGGSLIGSSSSSSLAGSAKRRLCRGGEADITAQVGKR
jgi:hypothetical protein